MVIVVRAFFVSSAVLLALLALSVPTIRPGSDTFVIAMLSFVMLGITLLGSAVCIYVGWDPFEELFG
ncbi:hypothetical protein K6T36_17745 (plasmid) [Halobaculum roseum]|nr:hypothetical protein K6T36_17745 [Halobaculum roseum]